MLQPMSTPGRVLFKINGIGPSWYRFPADPEAVSVARLFASGKLGDADPEFVSDVEVVASELMTNAINYAAEHGDPAPGVAPGIWLGVQPLDRFIHLYVRDPYPVPPLRRIASDLDESGRGLLIVELLSAAFWVESRAYDKTSHAIVTKPGELLGEDELARFRHV